MSRLSDPNMASVVPDAIACLAERIERPGSTLEGGARGDDDHHGADCGMGSIPAPRTNSECGHERLPCIVRGVVRDIEGHMGAGNERRDIQAVVGVGEEYRSPLRIARSFPQAT